MILYRNTSSKISTLSFLDRIQVLVNRLAQRSRVTQDAALDCCIQIGELESGLTDAFTDKDRQLLPLVRSISIHAARLFLNACIHPHGEPGRSDLLEAELDVLRRCQLPATIQRPVFEGLAFYDLRPENYIQAAEAFCREQTSKEVVCIGIRSIGVVLSSLVTAVLQKNGRTVRSYTVRPAGHPFDRRMERNAQLLESLRAGADVPYLIVDEGPGLSGSSFHSVASMLSEIGVRQQNIFLFPSWSAPEETLNNVAARSTWNSLKKYIADAPTLWPPPHQILKDLSAGKWRQVFLDDESVYPPVQPKHEAVKFLVKREETCILKFTGYGHYGRKRLEKAERLAGFIPEPVSLERGFLCSRFVEGSPLDPLASSSEILNAISRYIVFLIAHFQRETAVSFDEMVEMIQVNASELFPGEDLNLDKMEAQRNLFESEPAIDLDARMLPHEWLKCGPRYVKTDALDHSSSHFFPGSASILWDVASTIFEFDLSPSAEEYLLNKIPGLNLDLLPFFKLAYASFRAGYCSTQASLLTGIPDGAKFGARAEFFKRKMKLLLTTTETFAGR